VIFKWDPAKAAVNVKKHGVDFREAASVLEDMLSTTFPDVGHSRSSAPGGPPGASGDSMKKDRKVPSPEMLPEYDFASMKGGVRGKYVRRLRSGSNLVLLEPDVAEAFPTDVAVNQALRAAMKVASVVSKSRRLPGTMRPRSRITPRAKHGARR